MKKAILQCSFFAIACLCIISCKDDDPAPNSLVGTWSMTKDVASGCDDSADNYDETCTSSCETIVISETTINYDGDSLPYTKTATTISIVDGSLTVTVSYTVNTTTLVITEEASSSFGGCKFVTTYKKL